MLVRTLELLLLGAQAFAMIDELARPSHVGGLRSDIDPRTVGSAYVDDGGDRQLFDRLSGVVVFRGASLVVCAMKVPTPANGSDALSEAQNRPCCGGASRSISGTYEQIRLD